MLSKSGSASGLVIDGVTGVPAVGALLAGDLTLYVDNSNQAFSPDELARIESAVAEVTALVAPYGTNIIVVDGSIGLEANIVLNSGSTSVLGGMADGILGVATTSGEITIIDGWDWYAGEDSIGIAWGQFDFQTVIIHELAHSLGLGHSLDSISVMFPQLAPAETRRDLVFADLNIHGDDHDDSGLHAEAFFAATPHHRFAIMGEPTEQTIPERRLDRELGSSNSSFAALFVSATKATLPSAKTEELPLRQFGDSRIRILQPLAGALNLQPAGISSNEPASKTCQTVDELFCSELRFEWEALEYAFE